MKYAMKFMGREMEKPLIIQLEPEGTEFELLPGEEIKIIVEAGTDFGWSMSVVDYKKAIRLFPSNDYYTIDVFKNGELIG